MTEKTHAVPNGVIHYWMNDFQPGRAVLVFLPGLTADHRLFDKQIEAFESTYNLLAWDAPGHGKSRPFVMDFTLAQKAAWLHAILQAEGITAQTVMYNIVFMSKCHPAGGGHHRTGAGGTVGRRVSFTGVHSGLPRRGARLCFY